MTLATLEADTHMLRLNVLVKDIDRAGKAAVGALPPCLGLHHPRPDQAVWRLVHLIPEKASCSKDWFKSGNLAKAKLLQFEPNNRAYIWPQQLDQKKCLQVKDNLFIDAGTLICGQTGPWECCRTFHTADTHGPMSQCALPQCGSRGWCASSQHGRWSTASQIPPAATSWKWPLHRRAPSQQFRR